MRSCATGRKKNVNNLTSRLKTEGNISQFEKESCSDNLLHGSSFKIQSSDGDSFASSSINVKHRIQKQAQMENEMHHRQKSFHKF